jgi:hypothetical protein
MTLTAPNPRETLARTAVWVPDVHAATTFGDGTLIAALRELAAAKRSIEARTATLTAELARRSDRARGQDALSARLGAPTVEVAVQTLTGATRAEAKALTTVASAGGSPWFESVGSSVADGDLSVSAAAAIVTGLGTPSADVSADDLQDAAATLVESATTGRHRTPEDIARAARRAREELEREHIADLEEQRRNQRSLTWSVTPDGMTRMVALLDPESAAIITTALDTALSPRRGGPTFVDPVEQARAKSQQADARSVEQLAVDTLVEIVQLATRAAGATGEQLEKIFGVNSPAVRVHVTAETLITGVGAGWIEGQDSGISANTAARHICTSGVLPVLFAGNAAIDVGKAHRLHSTRQRIALAAQWGGCAWTGCRKPPSMTEIHHAEKFNGGNTTLVNGIPLCRFHHMQLHNSGWRIRVDRRNDGTNQPRYWVTPGSNHPDKPDPIELHPRR